MNFECKLAKYKSWTRQMKQNSEFKKFVFHVVKFEEKEFIFMLILV
jgi:hypothetical protein